MVGKFKEGDRVARTKDCANHELGLAGDTGRVEKDGPTGAWVYADNDRKGAGLQVFWSHDNIVLVDSKTTSDGGSSTYYDLPEGARDLDDLIEHKQMPWAVANIFKACYRFGEKAGTDKSYDVNKILFFAGRMKERLSA